VVGREELLEQVWGYDASVTTRTVDVHVSRLRRKLGRGDRHILTVRGQGYRFEP
jgi:DNA-binding response OmpR family regulator